MVGTFLSLLRRCYRLALPYGRFKLFGILLLVLANGALQLLGVTSVFPFFALASDPDRIRNSKFGSFVLQLLPAMDQDQLLIVTGVIAIVMLFLASLGSLFSEVARIRYAYGFAHWLRGKLFESYAQQPYSFFLARNSSAIIQKSHDIIAFANCVLLPMGEVLTRVVLVALLVGTVFFVQPWITVMAAAGLGSFYFVTFMWIRPRAKRLGDGLQHHNVQLAQHSYQFANGIKTILVHGSGSYFTKRILEHSKKLAGMQSLTPIYSMGPRYLVEPVAFGGMVGIVIVLAMQGKPFSDVLPNLSVMALAGYRLIPAMQLLYSQLVIIATQRYTLEQIEDGIREIEDRSNLEPAAANSGSLVFEKEIRLDQITFAYPGVAAPILRDFSLVVPKNASIGIAGTSGSGKSTLVDILLGLHKPQSGTIRVDGRPLTETDYAVWRSHIGYVPQDIYLLDGSIAENIAFGIPPEEINREALLEAAASAQIRNFIETELPEKWDTLVGERGVRLSGGQRQRIGLARALYLHPQLLILDEATSALDVETEAAVMQTIRSLQRSVTMVIIAHRLSTLEGCDDIIRLQKA